MTVSSVTSIESGDDKQLKDHGEVQVHVQQYAGGGVAQLLLYTEHVLSVGEGGVEVGEGSAEGECPTQVEDTRHGLKHS